MPSVWGNGWNTDIDQFVTLNADGTLTWTDPIGAEVKYFPIRQEPGRPAEYSNPINIYTSLTVTALTPEQEPQTLILRQKDGTETRFERQDSTVKCLLTELTDRNGNTVTYTRDAQGRVTQAVDVHGRSLSFSYNAAGLVASVADADFAGRTVTYLYNAAGDKTSETGPDGTTSYVYDANHRITEMTYPNGGKRTYTYDVQGRVLTESDDAGNNKRTYVYEPTRTLVTDARNHTTTYEFIEKSGLRRLSKLIDAKSQETTFEYDGNMNLVKQTDPLGRITQFEYDEAGNLTATVDPSGKRTEMQYEATFNQATVVSDPKGNTTNLTYDAEGNILQAKDSLNAVTNLTYDAGGHVTSVQDPLGKSTGFGYDARGAVASITDPLNRTTTILRDELSRITRRTDPKGKTTDFSYDVSGNPIQVTDALGGVTTLEYSSGRNGKLLTKVVGSEQQGTGQGTTFAYDLLGRLTSVTNALGQTRSLTYDKKGNLASVTSGDNQTITYIYDEVDRLSFKNLPEGTISYGYDAADNVTSISHHNGSSIQTAFDNRDRATLVTQTLPNGFSVQIGYGYDDNDNQTSMTTPWGNFSYSFDQLDRVTSITNPQGRIIQFAHDSLSRRTQLTYPNGTVATYAYDDAGQTAQVRHVRTSDSFEIAVANYTYDLAGNIVTFEDYTGIHSYAYDGPHRLTGATHPAGSALPTQTEIFDYDKAGNRLSDTAGTGYSYDDTNRLLSNSDFNFSYDANGNLTGKTRIGGETREYLFDSENRLLEIRVDGNSVARYKYDGLGRRVEKSVGAPASATVTRFVYDGNNLLAILDASNNLVAIFTQAQNLDAPLIVFAPPGDEFFLHADDLGSIVAVSDAAGALVERVEYQAFGAATFIPAGGAPSAQSTTPNPFAFIGRELDAESGLYFVRARFYDPGIGRFISEDPVFAALKPNLYVYARNNPATFLDSTGAEEKPKGPNKERQREINELKDKIRRLKQKGGNRTPEEDEEFKRLKRRQDELLKRPSKKQRPGSGGHHCVASPLIDTLARSPALLFLTGAGLFTLTVINPPAGLSTTGAALILLIPSDPARAPPNPDPGSPL